MNKWRLDNGMETQNKILTVIVPSYNMEAYLPKCLGSLIIDDKELLRKLEVIVVNDGSKDRTSEIAHEFEANYPGVFRVIDKKNGHYGSCINVGLAAAAGTFIKVLDADDWFKTGNFAEFLKLVESECVVDDNGTDLILSDWEEFNSFEGPPVNHLSFDYLSGRKTTIADIEFPTDGHRRRFEMFAITYRVSMLRTIGYRQQEGVAHTDKLWINLPMAYVRKFKVFSQPLYQYFSERQGNTCNSVEFYRTYHVQMEMLVEMIRQYTLIAGTIGEDNRIFMEKHLVYRTGRAYYLHIIDRNPLLRKEALKKLDDFLCANAPWLHAKAGDVTISRRFPYHYVRDWRRHQNATFAVKARIWFALSILRIYSRMLNLVKRCSPSRK